MNARNECTKIDSHDENTKGVHERRSHDEITKGVRPSSVRSAGQAQGDTARWTLRFQKKRCQPFLYDSSGTVEPGIHEKKCMDR